MAVHTALLSVFLMSCWGYARAIEGLDSALDSLTCSRVVEYSPGTIVDIKKSVEKGAKLLEGRLVEDQETCISHCCATEGCELALFKTNGISKGGNNCYLIQCGSPSSCEMVSLEYFVSMTFKKEMLPQEGEGTHQPMSPDKYRQAW